MKYKIMSKYIYMLSIALLFSLSAIAQEQISGRVVDQRGEPIEGVAISCVSSPRSKVISNQNGEFVISAEIGQAIDVDYSDAMLKRLWIDDKSIDIVLSDKDLVVRNGGVEQSSYRQTQSISTVSGGDIAKNSTANLTNALYGLMPGLMMSQNTGWEDNGTAIIRGGGSINGYSPLIVVDGFVRSMADVNLQDVESVSVLKDGAATALWGTRGANGVILVTTKRGRYNSMEVGVNYQHGVSIPVNMPEFADGYTFAMAKNEALINDGLDPIYDDYALAAFKDGSQADVYANTNWLEQGTRQFATNNQLDISVNGGGESVRYYSVIHYTNDVGILDDSAVNLYDGYNTQMKKYELSARMNIDIDASPNTLVSLSMYGVLRENKSPNNSDSDIFSYLFNTPSASFPVRNSNGSWASDSSFFKYNPIAEIGDIGYQKTNQRLLISDLKIRQDFSDFAPGLSANVGIGYDNSATFSEVASKSYSYVVSTIYKDDYFDDYFVRETSYGENTALEFDNTDLAAQYIRLSLKGDVAYNRAFGLHCLDAQVQYSQESYISSMGSNVIYYRHGASAVAGYNYANRYMVDLVANYSGTSLLSEGDQYRLYPAISGGWVISQENFMKGASGVDFLKLRASWGKSGNDDMEYDVDQQYWLSGYGYPYQSGNVGVAGLYEGTLGVTNLSCEVATKYNVGVDMQLFDKLWVTADAFLDQRRESLIDNSENISSVVGVPVAYENIGSMDTRGVELSVIWRDSHKDFNYYIGGNLSYLKSEIIENGEGYSPYSYQSKKGDPYGQIYGLEAIGYFSDQQDIDNSDDHTFSTVSPGDIKYKDQNGDHIINEDDIVAIGYSSSIPGLYYGINLGFEYKGFGVDAVFQGVGMYSKMLNTQSVYWPLRNNTSNISTWYLEDKIRWTEETKDTANLPRLTTQNNANNFQSSTQWLVDGSYLKLRNLNLYYNLPSKWIEPIGANKLQVYLRANNLFSIDSVPYMNCEDLSINYPDMTSVYLGVNVNF